MLDVTVPLLGAGLALRPGETVLVASDQETDPVLTEACWQAATALGAQAVAVRHHTPDLLPQSRLAFFPKAALEGTDRVPAALRGAAAEADAVVLLTSDLSMLVAQPAFQQMASRSRIALLPYMPHRRARRLLPSSEAEYTRLATEVDAIRDRLVRARTARLTSPGGTDLHLELGHHAPRVHRGRAEVGAPALLPGGQTTVVPTPGSAHGTLVIDRSIADDDYRTLHEGIRLTVSDGRVTDISGGIEAARLERLLAAQDDDAVYHLTELGVGNNGRCWRTGVGAPTEDTHTRGAVSLALGCDVHIGGVTPAPVHIDMTMWLPSLALDGESFVVGGELRDRARAGDIDNGSTSDPRKG